jgi:hypothetical protein
VDTSFHLDLAAAATGDLDVPGDVRQLQAAVGADREGPHLRRCLDHLLVAA